MIVLANACQLYLWFRINQLTRLCIYKLTITCDDPWSRSLHHCSQTRGPWANFQSTKPTPSGPRLDVNNKLILSLMCIFSSFLKKNQLLKWFSGSLIKICFSCLIWSIIKQILLLQRISGISGNERLSAHLSWRPLVYMKLKCAWGKVPNLKPLKTVSLGEKKNPESSGRGWYTAFLSVIKKIFFEITASWQCGWSEC